MLNEILLPGDYEGKISIPPHVSQFSDVIRARLQDMIINDKSKSPREKEKQRERRWEWSDCFERSLDSYFSSCSKMFITDVRQRLANMCFKFPAWLCLITRIALTKYHKFSGLTAGIYCLIFLEAEIWDQGVSGFFFLSDNFLSLISFGCGGSSFLGTFFFSLVAASGGYSLVAGASLCRGARARGLQDLWFPRSRA